MDKISNTGPLYSFTLPNSLSLLNSYRLIEFKKLLVSTYCVPGTILDIEGYSKNKTKSLPSRNLHSSQCHIKPNNKAICSKEFYR